MSCRSTPQVLIWREVCKDFAPVSQRARILFNTSVEKFVEKTSRPRFKHPNLNGF
jgi:hypothetical protein